jgi:hypothetical protein
MTVWFVWAETKVAATAESKIAEKRMLNGENKLDLWRVGSVVEAGKRSQ